MVRTSTLRRMVTIWALSTYQLHPGRLTWNLQITHLERKMIFKPPWLCSMLIFRGVTHPKYLEPEVNQGTTLHHLHPGFPTTWPHQISWSTIRPVTDLSMIFLRKNSAHHLRTCHFSRLGLQIGAKNLHQHKGGCNYSWWFQPCKKYSSRININCLNCITQVHLQTKCFKLTRVRFWIQIYCIHHFTISSLKNAHPKIPLKTTDPNCPHSKPTRLPSSKLT